MHRAISRNRAVLPPTRANITRSTLPLTTTQQMARYTSHQGQPSSPTPSFSSTTTTTSSSSNNTPPNQRASASAASSGAAEENTTTSSRQKKTMAELDEELRLKMEGMAGEGGSAGVEYEDGKAEGLKRGVKANMFRVI